MAEGEGHTMQIDNYTVFKDDEIGRGGFGTVYRARDADGMIVAVKKIIVKGNKRSAIQEAEIFFKRPLSHENIVQQLHIARPEPHFDLYIFMEFCQNGDLDKYFETCFDSLRTMQSKLHIMCQIANGLSFLHDQAVSHRDIKPANILISGSYIPAHCVVKISDFGLAKCLDPEGDTSAMSTDVGTIIFKAPEFHRGGPRKDIQYHKSVDVYAEGLTFLVMINAKQGCKLLPTLDTHERLRGSRYIGLEMYLRQECNQPPLDVAPNGPGDTPLIRVVKELIRRMTNVEPHHRPPAKKVLKILTEFQCIQSGKVQNHENI